jgi:hypothetical protein
MCRDRSKHAYAGLEGGKETGIHVVAGGLPAAKRAAVM